MKKIEYENKERNGLISANAYRFQVISVCACHSCLASCYAQISQVVNASLRAKNRSSATENKSRHCTQPSNWITRSGDDDQSVSQSISF